MAGSGGVPAAWWAMSCPTVPDDQPAVMIMTGVEASRRRAD